ncbi:13306_t:CDS:1, partial [Gigaspora rosea]
PRNKKRKRKIFQYNKMTQQNWEEYTTTLTNTFAKSTPSVQSTNQAQLDKSWNFWEAT